MSEEIKIQEAALNSVASSIMDITQGLGSESISNLDNMSTIDGNKASINSYDEIKESLKNIGSAMLSTSRNISAVGYSFNYRKPLEDIMPDFKKMNENEIRSYIRESESDIEEIEHKYYKEIEYESEQEAQIEREYFKLQNLLDSANSDPRLQGILCEGLDVISNIRQRRFELMDDLHNDKQRKIRESEENIQEARKQIYS